MTTLTQYLDALKGRIARSELCPTCDAPAIIDRPDMNRNQYHYPKTNGFPKADVESLIKIAERQAEAMQNIIEKKPNEMWLYEAADMAVELHSGIQKAQEDVQNIIKGKA